jgi:hypothetical protein
MFKFNPKGLFDPVWWRKRRWIMDKAKIIKGRMKWNVKKRINVALSTAKPPQIHCTSVFPRYGIADNKLVITVAPQKDICPQGRTYPTKAVAMVIKRITIPMNQVKWRLNDL